MCLVVIALKVNPQFPAVLAFNRDEFRARPTLGLHRWEDCPTVFAGRDVERGGTWAGHSADGRTALVTNFREAAAPGGPEKRSRGFLVADYLRGRTSAFDYLKSVRDEASRYDGFHLLVGEGENFFYYSNRDPGRLKILGPGIYGLSNGLLDTPWPKVQKIKAETAQLLARPGLTGATLDRELFRGLADETPFPADQLPNTGVGPELEKRLSPIFIRGELYGTRSSSVLRFSSAGVHFSEVTYAPPDPPRLRTFARR